MSRWTASSCKRNIDPKNIDTITLHLVDQLESHMSAEEMPTTAEEIKIDVAPYKEASVRDMLRKHERIWSGQLGEIKPTELRVDLKPDAKPLKSPPHGGGPKT